MQSSRPLIPAIVCLALLGAGCGLKAPLYLPDDKAQEVKRSESKKLPFPIKRTPSTMPPTQTPTQPPPAERSDGTPAPGTTSPPAVDPDRPATPPPGT